MSPRIETPGTMGFRMRAWFGPELVAFALSVVVILTVVALVVSGVLQA